MYLEHYGLRELPFSLTPDTSFFFTYGHYRDALNTLLIALHNGEGFIKVIGEVGTGKTLLCRKLLASLEDKYVTAWLPNPSLTPSALLLSLAEELGMEMPHKLLGYRALKAIGERLITLNAQGKRVMLCIDEAQAMPEQSLETLRLITNLETEKRKLLQVVLFGQPELEAQLRKPSVRQLRQRITFSYTLQPIDRQGMEAYVQHRLLVAGNQGQVHFTREAFRRLYQGSGGYPRLINILAHKALLLGYGQGVLRIDTPQVNNAIADTEGAFQLPRWPLRLLQPRLLLALGSSSLLLALLLHLFAIGVLP